MREEGFEFDAVKRKWHENGYIEANSQGKFVHQRKIKSVTTSFVKLNISKKEDESLKDGFNEVDGDLPF
jgi:hypothetical protein